MSRLALSAIAFASAIVAAEANAAVATEYFNGYGTAQAQLVGLDGGSGWAAAWTGDVIPAFVSLDDNAAFNLTYSAPGYSNSGNLSSTSDGASMLGTNGNAGNVAVRSLRSGAADTGLTGTIWASCLVNSGSVSNSHMLLWLDRPDVSNTFVSIRNAQAVLRYAATNVNGPAAEYAANTTYLLLAKVVINASGTNDTLDMWVNPNLAGGEAGLGAPKLSGANNTNVFGNAFSGIGVSYENYGKIDSIRISNGATAFSDVTMVPEPSLAAIAAAGALVLSSRRRKGA